MDNNSLRATIETVNFVEKCKIIEEDGEISQIFIEANIDSEDEEARTQRIKGIIRSVIGAVAVNHDLELDYRKIKVIEYRPAITQKTEVHPRVRIIAAYQRRYPQEEIVVELNCLEQDYVGKAAIDEDLASSTFKAFAAAFHQMGFGTLQLVFAQCLNNDLSRERIALVKIIHCLKNGNTDTLMGVAQIQDDLPLAVVKATLNAVNRRIVMST